MTKTIRVSDEYHEWLRTHNRDDETMEDTLRRVTGGPQPDSVAGLLTDDEAATAKAAAAELRSRDNGRLDAVRGAFGDEES